MFQFLYSSLIFFQVASLIYVIGIMIYYFVNRFWLKRRSNKKIIKLFDLALIVLILLTGIKIFISLFIIILSLWEVIFYAAIFVIEILLLWYFIKRYINTYKDEGYFKF